MTQKVISESDILSVMSVLTREGGDISFQIPTGDVGSSFERVFDRSRLMEVLNDVSFRVEVAGAAEPPPEQDDGSRSTHREQEPQPEARELRRGQAVVAAGIDDRNAKRRQVVQRHLQAKREASRRLAKARALARKGRSRPRR